MLCGSPGGEMEPLRNMRWKNLATKSKEIWGERKSVNKIQRNMRWNKSGNKIEKNMWWKIWQQNPKKSYYTVLLKSRSIIVILNNDSTNPFPILHYLSPSSSTSSSVPPFSAWYRIVQTQFHFHGVLATSLATIRSSRRPGWSWSSCEQWPRFWS